jgi:hypothetical protein
MLRQETILQREFIYKTIGERKIKLQRIYPPMRLANADVCFPNLSPVTGLTGIDRSTLDAGFREQLRDISIGFVLARSEKKKNIYTVGHSLIHLLGLQLGLQRRAAHLPSRATACGCRYQTAAIL